MIRLCRLCLVLLAVLGCDAATAGCAIADRLIDRYGISFSGFAQALPRATPPGNSQNDAPALVRIALPNRGGPVADGFLHSALIDKAGKRAWILRTGGFAGVHEWYGPVVLDRVDMAGCKVDSAH